MAQIVPCSSSPNQTLTPTLSVDGANLTLQLFIHWSDPAQYWVMSISDASGHLLVDSIPLVTGAYPAANLLGQFAYLGIGSAFIINVGADGDIPNRTNLGKEFQLLWDDSPTI